MTAKNLSPVETLIGVAIDIAKDGITVAESGQPVLQELSQFSNLVLDLPAAIGAIGALPGSLAGFSEPDAEALIQLAISKGAVSNVHAQAVVNAALGVGRAVYSLVLTLQEAKAAAASSPAAAPAPAAANPAASAAPAPAAAVAATPSASEPSQK